MRPDQRKVTGLVILYSLAIILIPLVLYGISSSSFPFSVSPGRIYVVFLLEFIWYNIVLLFMLRLASASLILFGAFLCMLYRLGIGVIFGLLVGISGEISLKAAVNSGIGFYAPALLIHVVFTPFILKSFFNQIVLWDMRKKKVLYQPPKREISLEKTGTTEPVVAEPQVEIRRADLIGPLRYIKEYSGVEGVFLVDNEGLVVEKEISSNLDDEKLAPFMLGLEKLNNTALKKIEEKKASRIELYTPSRWINLTRIFNLILVTVANRYTDELLNVRITQASEMIRKYMREKYTQEVLLEAEE